MSKKYIRYFFEEVPIVLWPGLFFTFLVFFFMKLLRNFWNKYLEHTEQLSWYYYAAALIFWLLFAYVAFVPNQSHAYEQRIFYYNETSNAPMFTVGETNEPSGFVSGTSSFSTSEGIRLQLTTSGAVANAATLRRTEDSWYLMYPNQETITVTYDVIYNNSLSSGRCGFRLYNGFNLTSHNGQIPFSSLDTGLQSLEFPTFLAGAVRFGPRGIMLYSTGLGSCDAEVVVKSLCWTEYACFFSVDDVPVSPEMNVTESIIQMPDVMNVQTDSLNYALGFMIFLMSVTAWYTIIRRK